MAGFDAVQVALSAAVTSVAEIVPKLGHMNQYEFNRISVRPGELMVTEGGVISPYSEESNFESKKDQRKVACAGHCDVQNGPGDTTTFVPRRGDRFFDRAGSPVSLTHALCLDDGDQRQDTYNWAVAITVWCSLARVASRVVAWSCQSMGLACSCHTCATRRTSW